MLIPGLRFRSVACSECQMFDCKRMCAACRTLGSPAEGDVASKASLKVFPFPAEREFNDLPFDPVEISCNFYDEQAIWSHAGGLNWSTVGVHCMLTYWRAVSI